MTDLLGGTAIRFPVYEELGSADEHFDADTDLQLTPPNTAWTLSDLGYPAELREKFPSQVAVTAPFQVFSSAGIDKLQRVVRALASDERHSTASGAKPAATGTMIRGTVHRSSFIRDFVSSSPLHQFVEGELGFATLPSYLSHELGHLNIPPTDPELPAVKWHCDTNNVVLVVNVFDSSHLDGGKFQFFAGHRNIGRQLLADHSELPTDSIVTPGMTKAGWGILIQGAAVLHRASPLRTPGERVTMASSFDPVDARYHDLNRFFPEPADPKHSDPEKLSQFFELSRHNARRSHYLLNRYLTDTAWSNDPDALADQLEQSIADVQATIDTLRNKGIPKEEATQRRKEQDDAFFV